MFSGDTSEINKELDLYFERFEDGFPLMQSNGDVNHIKEQINRCLAENTKAEQLWPNEYGACRDRNI